MKTKKLPRKHSGDFDSFEKPKKSGAALKKDKSSKKRLSIYDELDEMDEFVLSDKEFREFDDFYSDDDEDLY